MEQLTFELAAPEPPSFANFLPGSNAEVLATLRRVAAGEFADTGFVLWGPSGVGRTHLLLATVAAAAERRTAIYCAAPSLVPAALPAPAALVAVDDIGAADAEAQARLFSLFNALRAGGGQLVAAADAPPGRLALRDDLRSRLTWGLVYELVPLGDAEKPAALLQHARERGFALSADVIAYLLAHGRRDMGSLLAVLAALDRYSLAAKRPITVPLVRAWLQREMALASSGRSTDHRV